MFQLYSVTTAITRSFKHLASITARWRESERSTNQLNASPSIFFCQSHTAHTTHNNSQRTQMDQTAEALDQLVDSALAGVTLDDGSDDTQLKVMSLIVLHGIREERKPTGA